MSSFEHLILLAALHCHVRWKRHAQCLNMSSGKVDTRMHLCAQNLASEGSAGSTCQGGR